nr:MAG TPA: hypothetical protein [Microviridae sp.]
MDRRRDSTRILFCNISIYHNVNYVIYFHCIYLQYNSKFHIYAHGFYYTFRR